MWSHTPTGCMVRINKGFVVWVVAIELPPEMPERGADRAAGADNGTRTDDADNDVVDVTGVDNAADDAAAAAAAATVAVDVCIAAVGVNVER
jgi:hypothetical protein